jgi:hypothetical protein
VRGYVGDASEPIMKRFLFGAAFLMAVFFVGGRFRNGVSGFDFENGAIAFGGGALLLIAFYGIAEVVEIVRYNRRSN